MPAIWMFTSATSLPKAAELTRFFQEELGMTAEIEAELLQDSIVHYKMHITPEDGSGKVTGHARAAALPRAERDEETQTMIDEVVEQAPELQEVFEGNALDVALEFENGDTDSLAGCLIAYALSTTFDCGLLVTELPEGDGDEEEEEEAEDDMAVSCWFDTAEDFADEFFPDDDEADDDYEEDEEGDDAEDEGDDEGDRR